MEVDSSRWSGDGDFTRIVLARLHEQPGIAALRIEDAPASHEDAGYSFISNEVFICPAPALHREAIRRFGVWPSTRMVALPGLTLPEIEERLSADPVIGAPDFSDGSMLQYLRTQRIIPAYQTRGYKLVELVRIYMAGAMPRR